jgi:hypothetical protein
LVQSGTKIAALVSSRQALISCAHFVVDDIFTTVRQLCSLLFALYLYLLVHSQEYPWFSSLSDKSKEKPQEEEEEMNKEDKSQFPSRSSRKPIKAVAAVAPIQDPALTSGIRELNVRLRRLVHRSLSDIVDPSRYVVFSHPVYSINCPLVDYTRRTCFSRH